MIKFPFRDDGMTDIIVDQPTRERWKNAGQEAEQMAKAFGENEDAANQKRANEIATHYRGLLHLFAPEKPGEPTTIGPPPREKAKPDKAGKEDDADE